MTQDIGEILAGEKPAGVTETRTEDKAPVEKPEASAEAPVADDTEQHEDLADGLEPERGFVPQKALHASRERAKQERERAEKAEREAAELRGRVAALTESRQPQPAPQPVKEPEKTVSFWENPEEFVSQLLTKTLSPVQQDVQRRNEGISRRMAVQSHGQETVQSAYSAMGEALQRGDQAAALEYRRMMASDHPYEELVQWHRRTDALSVIGNDPAAYRERVKAEIRAEMEAEAAKGGQQQPPSGGTTPPVLPSDLAGVRNVGSRSGPAWGGPKPLNDIFDRNTPRAKAG